MYNQHKVPHLNYITTSFCISTDVAIICPVISDQSELNYTPGFNANVSLNLPDVACGSEIDLIKTNMNIHKLWISLSSTSVLLVHWSCGEGPSYSVCAHVFKDVEIPEAFCSKAFASVSAQQHNLLYFSLESACQRR